MDQDAIKRLEAQIQELMKRQQDFAAEIHSLQQSIATLKSHKSETTAEPAVAPQQVAAPNKEVTTPAPEKQPTTPPAKLQPLTPRPVVKKKKSDLERFIGENLINKIGIVVTIIGVVIGAKYTIENNLISPLTRIILGYLLGVGLLFFGIRLKKNYLNFSAVLVSGAMVIMYFISFAAFSFYELIGQELAFGLMVVFTVFTVVAALNYKQSIIAHLGLVGAYAVPFLLSPESGDARILFTYMLIINVGILIISFRQYWKSLHYSAFVFTWLIYTSWYFSGYDAIVDFWLALAFATAFYLVFYVNFLSYKLIVKEKFDIGDIFLLIANSFIFYAFGYATLLDHPKGEEFLGLFTLINAIIHFVVGTVIYRQKLADKNLFYLVIGLVLVFLTLAIPVQLDGNWVTMLWIAEAVVLFWIGRHKKVPLYEYISYVLTVLSVLSLIHDWSFTDSYNPYDENPRIIPPIINKTFLTAVIVLLGMGGLLYMHKKFPSESKNSITKTLAQIFGILLPGVLIIFTYVTFRIELVLYFNQLFESTAVMLPESQTIYGSKHFNYDLRDFETLWVHIYSLVFLGLLGLLNLKKFKNQILGIVLFVFTILAILAFLGQGSFTMSALRESYLNHNSESYFSVDAFHLIIRYVGFGAMAFAIYIQKLALEKVEGLKILSKPYEIFQHLVLLAVLSIELIHWMDMAGVDVPFKLGLSILWGLYALFLIVMGIWKRKAYLRVTAIIIFGITLLKLFFYDIAHLNTISKTIVFVSLGLLLLIISFLYNKFKTKISNEETAK